MIRCGVLLAAGASYRFGPPDKLLATLADRPLIAHAAAAMRGATLDRRIAVIANPALIPWLGGFDIVQVPAGGDQSASLRAAHSVAGNPDRLLIALADMPFVTCTHLDDVVAAASDDCPSASRDTGPPMPPACFPQPWLPRLAALTGDRGAGGLIRDLPAAAIIHAPGKLSDIDRQDDLANSERTARTDRPSHSFQIPRGSGGGAPGGRGTP